MANKRLLFYQLYAFSWLERGGLKAMTRHLGRIAALSVDIVWLSGILESPQRDHGYDISDYSQIDMAYGSMEDMREFIDTAHQLDMKVIIDLVLNHTSIFHPWFKVHPSYYCWNDCDRPDWKNLFDGGSAWKYNMAYDKYYCHLFHETQADLNWLPKESDELNQDLVNEFKDIVNFWTKLQKVDGFRLDVPQAINKDFSCHKLEFKDLVYRKKAAEVLNAIFNKESHPLLLAEIFDPTFGNIIDYYINETPIDYALNVLLKQSIPAGPRVFREHLQASILNPNFVVDIESHDSPRARYKTFGPTWHTHQIFASDAKAICLYQGQELGLDNPSKKELSDKGMLRLDAQTAMRHARGESLDALRPTSRANARVPLSLREYEKQERNPKSCLNLTKLEIQNWRNRR